MDGNLTKGESMFAERYVAVKVGVFEDKKFHVTELTFVKDDYFGNYYKFPDAGHSEKIHSLTDMVWDMKKKCFKPIVTVEYKETCEQYKIGQSYLIENSNKHRTLSRDELVDIEFVEYETSYSPRKKIDDWILKRIENFPECQPDEVVEIRQYKPTYVFKSGWKTNYNHQIYFIAEES